MARIVLLGPQRFVRTVRRTLDDLAASGPLAVITAGWEEREDEVEELHEHVGRPVRKLRLWQRGEEVLARDAELHDALVALDDTLRRLQALYRVRLRHAMDAVRELVTAQTMTPEPERQAEVEHALGAVHVLDQHHLGRTADALARFDERLRPLERPALAEMRETIATELSDCAATAIAGGHVAVLLGRLRLFVMDGLLTARPIVAWSAGAMALTEQVVLFHDSPPQGRGHAEVLSAGLGLCKERIVLPHARRRLLLSDASRVAIFARRFLPATCVLLDEASRTQWDGRVWRDDPGTRRLSTDGRLLVAEGR